MISSKRVKTQLCRALWQFRKPYYRKNLSEAYTFARDHIPCECPKCRCPARDRLEFSFRYVDEHRKLIYYSVPKSASTSLRQLFFNRNMASSLSPLTHAEDEYVRFSFVRNPWDRMVSIWSMFTSLPGRIRQIESMTSEDVSSFEDFVNMAKRKINHHWLPQTVFVPNDLDFIGRVERMDHDVNALRRLIGEEPVAIGKHNASRHDEYREYYTPALIDEVGEMYADDIERFGYTFD